MSESPLEQARARLAALREAARSGAPVAAGLPEQIDAILALLDDAVRQEQARASELMSTAVHEMRIPLTSIRGYIDMLAKGMLGPLPEQQQQFADTIRANTLRLERLIADVNDYAKSRGGRLFLNPRPETVGNVLLGVHRRVDELAAGRGVTLAVDAPGDLPLLTADGPRLAQALAYLVENAVDYSPAGSTVALMVRAEGTNALSFTVADHGDRHRGRRAGAYLYRVCAGGFEHDAPVWRHRPGAGHLAQSGASAGWRDHRAERGRGRIYLHPRNSDALYQPHAAGGERTGCACMSGICRRGALREESARAKGHHTDRR